MIEYEALQHKSIIQDRETLGLLQKLQEQAAINAELQIQLEAQETALAEMESDRERLVMEN